MKRRDNVLDTFLHNLAGEAVTKLELGASATKHSEVVSSVLKLYGLSIAIEELAIGHGQYYTN